MLATCGGSSESGSPQVTGEIVLPDGATVPDSATINVQVQDTSKADAAAVTIGEQVIEGNGQQGTIPFAVSYDPSDIDDRFEYSMRVRIEDENGSLLFINDTFTPVITRGAPTTEVVVEVIAV
jgi:putative lipoprotein